MENESFFSRTILQFGRTLAKVKPTPSQQLQKLLSLCPSCKDSEFIIDQKGQNAVFALGVYILESDLQYKDIIIDYLITLLRGLSKAVWKDEVRSPWKYRIPSSERFAFLLTTLLSDIAARSNNDFDLIVSALDNLFADVISTVISTINQNQLINLDSKVSFSRGPLPVLLGVSRALGRFVRGRSLFLLIFPAPSTSIENQDERFSSQKRSASSFHSIFPRSLSSSIIKVESDSLINVNNEKATEKSSLLSIGDDNKPTTSQTFDSSDSFDPEKDLFFKLGSCFDSAFIRKHTEAKICFPISHLQSIFSNAKKLLTKDFVLRLNEIATEVFMSGYISVFPYKTVKEVLTLVIVTLLRQIFDLQEDLPHQFIKDVQDFVKCLYVSGQTDLANQRHQSSAKSTDDLSNQAPSAPINAYKINVQANAAIVDLLVWSSVDESDADRLSGKLTEKLNLHQGHRLILAQIPMLVVCLQGLGKLAEKFPNIAATSLTNLQEFLVGPSPILVKLHLQSSDTLTPYRTAYYSKDSSKPFSPTLKAFEKLRDTAIENLCVALKAGMKVDATTVLQFISSISNREKSSKERLGHSESSMVSSNVIIASSHVAITLRDQQKITSTILHQCLVARLCGSSSVLDTLIVDQMGCILLANDDEKIFDEIMEQFRKIITESSSFSHENPSVGHRDQKMFRHIEHDALNALANVAASMQKEKEIHKLLIKLMELFLKLGLEAKSGAEKATTISKLQVFSLFKTTGNAGPLEILIKVIAVLMKRIPAIREPTVRLLKMFRDFWLFYVVLKLGQQDPESHVYMREIAFKSPLLLSRTHMRSEIRDLKYSYAVTDESVSVSELADLKHQIMRVLGQPQDITPIVNKLTFSQCIFIISIYRLEDLRIRHAPQPNFQPMFDYLLDPAIQNDKYGMWTCINRVSEKIFETFLDLLNQNKRNETQEHILVRHAQFLLALFNHTQPQITRVADKLLTNLFRKFPLLLWNTKVLHTMIDILQVLGYSLQLDPNEANPTIPIINTPFSITLKDTLEAREQTVNHFNARCNEILQEAMKWAPVATRSHLQNYQLSLDSSETASHFGLALATESLLSYAGISGPSLPYLQNIGKGVKISSGLTSNFMKSLSMRTRFKGEISGILSMTNSEENLNKCMMDLANNIKMAAKQGNFTEFQRYLWRATSFLIASNGVHRGLLRVCVFSCLDFFCEDVMENAVSCWQWILSSRTDLILPFVCEMISAWEESINKKLGLFSVQEATANPLAAYEGCDLTPKYPNVYAHNIWIKFIQERIEIARYESDDQVAMFTSMFHKTLDSVIGCYEAKMSRHVNTVGTRFRLLYCALTLVQSDTTSKSLTKGVLRERIYAACLDYFCSPRAYPCKRTKNLKEDIQVLLLFWNSLHSDKKYLNPCEFEEIHSFIMGSNNFGSNSSYLRDASSEYGLFNSGWANTAQRSTAGTLSSYSKRSEKTKRFTDKGDRDLKIYMKKRELILSLLALEIQALRVWLHPPLPATNVSDLTTTPEESLNRWIQKNCITHKRWKTHVKFAWTLSPALAVYLPTRVVNVQGLHSEIRDIVKMDAISVCHIPEALQYLATSENILSDAPQLNDILLWEAVPPIAALAFFSRQFPSHPLTAQYAVRVLSSYPSDTVLFYIPQLLQALRHDKIGYLSEFIKQAALKSQLLAHQMIWNMETNKFTDEEGHKKDEELFDLIENLQKLILSNFSGAAKLFYEREFDFFQRITNISALIKPFPKGAERKKACLKALKDISLKDGCYLPSNPNSIIIDIDRDSGTPMQSAAKAPYLAKFKVRRCGINELERQGLLVSSGEKVSQKIGQEMWQAAIFKVGDDVRQDMLALQVISLFKNIFKTVDLDLFLFGYRVVATSPGSGVIECVPNAKSRDQLGRATDTGMYEYFVGLYGNEDSPKFQQARSNFVKSMAAYSIVSYLLQIKDRHNGNIMLDEDGHIIHIDFGFMFESSPGGNLGFEPDIKLTQEMFMIMGGKVEAAPFKWFVELCIKGFLAVRPYQEAIVSLVSLMLDTGLPCFRGQTIRLLRSRFGPDASEKEAAELMMNVIHRSNLNVRTKAYDWIQYYQNQIPC